MDIRSFTFENVLFKIYTIIKKKSIQHWGAGGFVKYPLYIIGSSKISIGNKFSCQRRVRLEAILIENVPQDKYLIKIGNSVSINWDCHIGAINKIEIGNNVLIGSKVVIIDHQHGEINSQALNLPPNKRPLWSKGPIKICDNVWIGENVCILPGVEIGANSIIGANSVVTKNIPPNSVAAGSPAKIIKTL